GRRQRDEGGDGEEQGGAEFHWWLLREWRERETDGLRAQRQGDRAQLAAALCVAALRLAHRPGEGNLEQFAAADLADRLDHQGVAARGEAGLRRMRVVELQRMAAGGARRPG